MARISLITVTILSVSLIHVAVGTIRFVTQDEWDDYKATYNKSYRNYLEEMAAKTVYGVNSKLILNHNALYDAGINTYRLRINQFTDLRVDQFISMFPLTARSRSSNDKAPPRVQTASPSYDPRNLGLQLNIEDQGMNCNSGWAYAAAKAIEYFKASEMGNVSTSSLSAQNLIDCAGQGKACNNQIPEAAFEYLTQHKMKLYFEKDYKNDINAREAHMCTPPTNAQQLPAVNLTAYSKLRNGNVESLKAYVSAGMPVVVKFNPASFQFAHYADGIFQQPLTGAGDHFMVVIGYGTDSSTNKNYWLLQNSFGTSWGIGGLMKLRLSSDIRLFESVVFPSES